MTLASLKSYSSFLKGATINISPNVYRGLDLSWKYANTLLFPYYDATTFYFPFWASYFQTATCEGQEAPRRREYSGLHRLQNWAVWLQSHIAPWSMPVSNSSLAIVARRLVGYSTPRAMQLWRPLCTETFMENDWALSPHQMWWEIKPEEPGCSWGGDTEELGSRAR